MLLTNVYLPLYFMIQFGSIYTCRFPLIPQENKLSLHNQVDHNILIQYLQSLIASQQALTSMLNCPYQSLQAEDGSLMVIRQVSCGTVLYIYVSNESLSIWLSSSYSLAFV